MRSSVRSSSGVSALAPIAREVPFLLPFPREPDHSRAIVATSDPALFTENAKVRHDGAPALFLGTVGLQG